MFHISAQEISLTDRILGKGAFGEVRVACWRNIDVAYKRPHLSLGSAEALAGGITEETLLQEIEVLSQLRHPNLVLFIGTCRDPETAQLAIVTELLPCSLYDILEGNKVRFSLADVLDVASDVISGLDYLHGHNPIIVHRDISAKNILIGGNRAKIADLGQAKIFSSTNSNSVQSRQSKLPGAMAYAAPETLTGKYSSPIDIFSFGILLSQMCTGEYPRIDRREEQIQAAGEAFPVFKELIEACVHYQPPQRPSASSIARSLRNWMQNDRHYPVSRRQSPEKDVGILALHWMHDQIAVKVHTLEMSLHQQTQLLQREEARWRAEAQQVDTLNQEIQQKQETIDELNEVLRQQDKAIKQQEEQLRKYADSDFELRAQLKMLSSEQEKLLKKIDNMEGSLAGDSVQMQQLRQKMQQMTTQNQHLEAALATSQTKQDQGSQRETMLHRQLEMQVNYARDVEERLEQTLVRWREEHETRQRFESELQKLNRKCSEFLTREQKWKDEVALMEKRLARYEGLPVPEEIKMRLQDQENDNELLRETLTAIESEKEKVTENYQTAQQEVMQLEQQRALLQEQIQAKDLALQQRIQEHEAQRARWETQKQQLQQETKDITQRQQDTTWDLKAELVKCNTQLQKLESELAKSLAWNLRYREVLFPPVTSLSELVEAAMSIPHSQQSQVLSDGDHQQQQQDQGGLPLQTASENIQTGNASPMGPISTPLPQEQSLSDERIGLPTDENGYLHMAVSQQGNLPWQEIDTSAISTQAMMEAKMLVAQTAAEAEALQAQLNKPVEKLTDIAVKHLVERAQKEYGLQGLIAVVHHPTFVEDERILWRTARALHTLLVQGGEVARALCAPSFGTPPSPPLPDAGSPSSSSSSPPSTVAAVTEKLSNDVASLPQVKCTSSEKWVLRLLSTFPHCAMLQAQSLRILGALSFQHDLFRRKVGERGAVYFVLQALQRHYITPDTTSENVVLYACSALTNLCHASPENRARFYEYHGYESVLTVMQHFLGTGSTGGKGSTDVDGKKHRHVPQSARVLCQCCYVLLTVAAGTDPILARSIIAHNGDAIVLRALQKYPRDLELQQYGLWALGSLAVVAPDIAQGITAKGGVEYCQMVLEMYTAMMQQQQKLQPGDTTEMAGVVRQAHATLHALLKPTTQVRAQSQQQQTSFNMGSTRDEAVGAQPEDGNSNKKGRGSAQAGALGQSTKRQGNLTKEVSKSNSTSTLLLPAIAVYSNSSTHSSNNNNGDNSKQGVSQSTKRV